MPEPLYIPSRGRAGEAPAISETIRDGLEPIVVVPEEEVPAYERAYPEAEVVGLDPKLTGIGRTRNWILEDARANGFPRFWMLDDDLDDPRTREHHGAPYTFIPWSDWMEAIEDLSHGYDAACGMNRQYAWPEEAALVNKRMGYAVLLTPDSGPWHYWPFMHEDTDITLQILTQGGSTIKFPQYVFHTTTMGLRPGGCKSDYQKGYSDVAAGALVQKWETTHPGLVRIKKNKAGFPTTRIDWRRFRGQGPDRG